MLKCNIISVGSLKERYFQDALAEYLKRLSRFALVKNIEVAEEKERKGVSIAHIIEKEGERLLSCAKGVIVALDKDGQAVTSEGFAKILIDLGVSGKSETSFLLGGSYGLSNAVKAKADIMLSFGSLTYPHQLARVMLAEQLYRAFTIKENINYHK